MSVCKGWAGQKVAVTPEAAKILDLRFSGEYLITRASLSLLEPPYIIVSLHRVPVDLTEMMYAEFFPVHNTWELSRAARLLGLVKKSQ